MAQLSASPFLITETRLCTCRSGPGQQTARCMASGRTRLGKPPVHGICDDPFDVKERNQHGDNGMPQESKLLSLTAMLQKRRVVMGKVCAAVVFSWMSAATACSSGSPVNTMDA